MGRRLLAAVVAAALLAGCGGAAATPTAAPATAEPTATTSPTKAPIVTEAPITTPAADTPTPGTVMTASCGAVALRKEPRKTGQLVIRVAAGSKVNVVGSVSGDAYAAGTCGPSGKKWIKIDQVDGASIQATYGVVFVYAAAGFFK
ncbi:MAG: hypothetical protein WCK58_16315 [Chloroflexota bacterium]